MFPFLSKRQPHINKRKITVIIVMILLILAMSCSFTSSSSDSLAQTKAALDVQMTILAQQSGQNAQATNQAAQLTSVAQNVQNTMLVQQATQLAAQATQLAQGQSNPISGGNPADTNPQPQTTSAPPEEDVEDQIKSAKILLFEDMAGTGELEYYQEALENGGYQFKDDGSAQGWFKDDLLSGNNWDLVIAASESRTKIQGEFFQYLLDYINKGVAVIIEHWDLDDLSEGKVAPILSKCGVALQRDWYIGINSFADLSVWPLVTDHPIFHEPNDGISLRNFNYFWGKYTDQGDFLKLATGGDATMLAGNIATSKSDHGTLVSCVHGRLIIQTFSSHTYKRNDVTRIIQNYVHYTLKNHFLTKP